MFHLILFYFYIIYFKRFEWDVLTLKRNINKLLRAPKYLDSIICTGLKI
jgi:hypothetical protein